MSKKNDGAKDPKSSQKKNEVKQDPKSSQKKSDEQQNLNSSGKEQNKEEDAEAKKKKLIEQALRSFGKIGFANPQTKTLKINSGRKVVVGIKVWKRIDFLIKNGWTLLER